VRRCTTKDERSRRVRGSTLGADGPVGVLRGRVDGVTPAMRSDGGARIPMRLHGRRTIDERRGHGRQGAA
jgi:hypothetical protein